MPLPNVCLISTKLMKLNHLITNNQTNALHHVINYVMPSFSVIGWSGCGTGSQQRTACNNPRRSPHSERCNWTELQRLATPVASSRFARTCDDQRFLLHVVATPPHSGRRNRTELLQFGSVQLPAVGRPQHAKRACACARALKKRLRFYRYRLILG